jgi:hypothetical protein
MLESLRKTTQSFALLAGSFPIISGRWIVSGCNVSVKAESTAEEPENNQSEKHKKQGN